MKGWVKDLNLVNLNRQTSARGIGENLGFIVAHTLDL
jgi:hypothetical protein